MTSPEVLPQPCPPSDDTSQIDADARGPLVAGVAIFLTLVRFWPLTILVGVVLIPVAPGIFLIAVAGVILAPPYLLARRLASHGAGDAFASITRRRADQVLAQSAPRQLVPHRRDEEA